MPLPKPALDNRNFDQLVSEGRALLARRAPRWTDHNASDPGITLLELGAWLAEQNFYRFDRLSDEAIRAFVRLLGIEPGSASVAQTVVAIGNPGATAVQLPPRVQLANTDQPLFETTEPLHVFPATLARVLTGGNELTDVTEHNARRDGFFAFGPRPRAGHALYLGFDHPLNAAGATLSLHLWTVNREGDRMTRAALVSEAEAQAGHLNGACEPLPDWRRHYRVSTVWEYLATGERWLPLLGAVDETRALTLTGFVRFAAPLDHEAIGTPPLCYVRCRIASARFECPPRLVHVAFNAVPAEHALTRAEKSLGRSRGHAGALFALGEAPIVAGSVQVRLVDDTGTVQSDWREVPDWDRTGAHERAFRLDPERGEIHSGDGLRGQIVPAGHDVHASYRLGGGSAGNVAAGTLATIPLTAQNLALAPALAAQQALLEVVQPFAATRGAPGETLQGAQARAFEVVSGVDKAVTIEDIERLALATPGVPVARVRAFANLLLQLPCFPTPGVVTLVVIPACPSPAPMPSRAMLDAIERYLEPRRLVSSEIHAIAPRYRRVGVHAVVHVACDADANPVRAQALKRVAAFFDPLAGGTDGAGWPFGRTVYRSEVMALLANTDGVMRVTSFALQTGGASAPRCDNVELCPWELVAPGSHHLVIRIERARNFEKERGV